VDVLAILETLKNKALDAAHVELLRSAYQLQERNIEQLKTNNEALRENAELFKNANGALKAELEELRTRCDRIARELPRTQALFEYEPSEVAEKILRHVAKLDRGFFRDVELSNSLNESQLKIEASLHQLEDREIVRLERVDHHGDRGREYRLTPAGTAFVVERYKHH